MIVESWTVLISESLEVYPHIAIDLYTYIHPQSYTCAQILINTFTHTHKQSTQTLVHILIHVSNTYTQNEKKNSHTQILDNPNIFTYIHIQCTTINRSSHKHMQQKATDIHKNFS